MKIDHNLDVLNDIEKYGAPFWDMPNIIERPYFKELSNQTEDKKMLFISGPSRNGNHLLHSMLDGHPEICSLPGEDSFLAAFFQDLRLDPEKAIANIKSEKNIDYILNLTGWGVNKWQELWKLNQSKKIIKMQWSGTQPQGQGYITDYQDTIVSIDYPSYFRQLQEFAEKIRTTSKFMNIFWMYLEAMRRLNPEARNTTIGYSWVGSGMRAEMRYVFENDNRVFCVAPIRPFESFYYSFAKGRMQTEEIKPDIINEAWEHWLHKTLDYLFLKREYPERFCLVNFNNMIEKTYVTAENICNFLGVAMSDTCLVPTTLGQPTKGNSSFPKKEQMRGKFYSSGMKRKLHQDFWPDIYTVLWEKVAQVSL